MVYMENGRGFYPELGRSVEFLVDLESSVCSESLLLAKQAVAEAVEAEHLTVEKKACWGRYFPQKDCLPWAKV